MSGHVNYECDDFLGFQEAIRRMRFMDDKIIYTLNTSLPTESFKSHIDPASNCKQLYNTLQTNYKSRESSIKQCIAVGANRLKILKEMKEEDSNNIALIKEMKGEQTKIRLLQTELGVEEVIRERTNKVYQERCKHYFRLNLP